MSNFICHPYHLVNESPWPIISSVGGVSITIGLVTWFHLRRIKLLILGLLIILLVKFQWWKDVSHEGSFQGFHSKMVELGLRWGIILFIISEVFFFLSFFWAFFHASLAPDVRIGNCWPPIGISPFNALEVPLLNTIILLSSGISITWAHHALINGDHNSFIISITLTIILGVYFTSIQAMEYLEARFNISDGVYGSSFFVATGFHGLHVLIGTTFLIVCLIRGLIGHFSVYHHFGFEAAAWYWHFVDVVWLFLFIAIYWWGARFRNSRNYFSFTKKQ